MAELLKESQSLGPSDFSEHPVWEFADDLEEISDTLMRPVLQLPVDDMSSRIIGTPVTLSNGESLFGVIGNLALNSPRRTRQFITFTVYKDGTSFDLARYHDPDYSSRSAQQLAEFLSLPIDDVFPFRYDISAFCVGDPSVVVGTIEKEAGEKLTLSERIQLALS